MECYTDDRSDLVILGCTGLGMSVSPQFVLLVVERLQSDIKYRMARCMLETSSAILGFVLIFR